jgi:hypothetical protein
VGRWVDACCATRGPYKDWPHQYARARSGAGRSTAARTLRDQLGRLRRFVRSATARRCHPSDRRPDRSPTPAAPTPRRPAAPPTPPHANRVLGHGVPGGIDERPAASAADLLGQPASPYDPAARSVRCLTRSTLVEASPYWSGRFPSWSRQPASQVRTSGDAVEALNIDASAQDDLAG